jgi:putative membrane protein
MQENENKRSILQLLLLSLKGMAMGAADVVPGVSGGTIAFISGIYEELIEGINSINLKAITVLRKEGIKAFWQHVHGTFFFFLLAGIGASILLLSKVVQHLLETHPVLIWSFFFGLVLASMWLVGKTIAKWNPQTILFFAAGTAIAAWISTVQTVAHVDANWYIFISGAIAICAMILPGISGSFILVLMGSYHTVLGALTDKNFTIIGLFMAGCLVGILSFSRLLKYLFANFKNATIALLTGFLLGSLLKIWPWKVNVGATPLVIHSDGREEWMTANALPSQVADPQVGLAIACALGGLILIIGLEYIGKKFQNA